MVLPWYSECVQAAAEDSAAGSSGAEPEAEDGQRTVRAVCEGDDVWPSVHPQEDILLCCN